MVHARRVIVNAIVYVNRTGPGAWRYLPSDFPPWRTVYGYFARWRDDGTRNCCTTGDATKPGPPLAATRPTTAVIDSQPVRAADTVPRASRAGITPRRTAAASGTSPSTPPA